MMATEEQQKRPSVQESYAGAVSEGKTRPQERTTRADLIASAGMSQYSTGTALMRLVSEWNSGAVPKEQPIPDAKALALEIATARVRQAMVEGDKLRDEAGEPRLRIARKADRLAVVTVSKADMELARAQLVQRRAQSTDWSLEESKLRFQRLKTLPTLRAALQHWVRERGWDDGEYLVAKVLQHFLSPKCLTCGGSGVLEFAGNNGKAREKACPACKRRQAENLKALPGELPVPCHGRGKALLAHIRSCMARAAGDVGEGIRRERRGEQSEADRQMHRFHEQVAKLRRADEEARDDASQDSAAIAEKFRASMGRRR